MHIDMEVNHLEQPKRGAEMRKNQKEEGTWCVSGNMLKIHGIYMHGKITVEPSAPHNENKI